MDGRLEGYPLVTRYAGSSLINMFEIAGKLPERNDKEQRETLSRCHCTTFIQGLIWMRANAKPDGWTCHSFSSTPSMWSTLATTRSTGNLWSTGKLVECELSAATKHSSQPTHSGGCLRQVLVGSRMTDSTVCPQWTPSSRLWGV